MKRHILIVFLAIVGIVSSHAQQVTPALTVYKQFKPATVLLADGKKMKLPLANIFLKNSTLLYKSGLETKQANMKTLLRVDFEGRSYLRIDTLLAYQVDTVNHDVLYCAQMIDMDSYRQQIANNREITSLDINDMIGYTTVDLQNEQDIHFPIKNVFIFRINGKFVIAHERSLKRLLTKEKRRILASAMAMPGFSWNDEKSLMNLLKMIQ
jgi:hypothetical protein